MTKVSYLVFLLLILMSVSASATLVDNQDGTITDTDTNLMWFKDGNYAKTSGYHSTGYMPYYDPYNGIDLENWLPLINNNNTFGYNDWRLPSCVNKPYTSCPNGELQHLFNNENVRYLSSGPFINFQQWYGTGSIKSDMGGAFYWLQDFSSGGQPYAWEQNEVYFVLVREVTSSPPPVVPEPISSILFVTGGTLLAGRRFIRRKV